MRPIIITLALLAAASPVAARRQRHRARPVSSSLRATTGAAVILTPCSSALQWGVNSGNIGVVYINGVGCLSNAGAGAELTLQTCVAGDAAELGYNITSTSLGPVEWSNSTLCLSAASISADQSVQLSPCAAATALPLYFNSTSSAITVAGSAPSICLSLASPLLSSVYGDNMVLSARKPSTFRGVAEPGASVNVSYTSSSTWAVGVVGGDGHWNATLPAQAVGGPINVTAVQVGGARAGASQVLTNVMFGVVIAALGQSNMAGENTPVSYVVNGTAEVAGAGAFPYVRIMQVGTFGSGSDTPLYDLEYAPSIPWSQASPSSVSDFSGLAWLTGKHVATALGSGVPIGIMESAWGGTSIQVWLSAAALAACGTAPPSYPGGWPKNPSVLFNGQVSPFLPLAVDAFIWMQGESNALNAQAAYYDCALPSLINDWRAQFSQSSGAFFGVAQLAPWASSPASANEMTAELRHSELHAVAGMPNVTTATAVDGGDPYAPNGSIHPRDKQALAARLGNAMLHTLFGMSDPIAFAGPTYASSTAGGGPAGSLSATVRFSGVNASSPLVMVPPSPNGPLANSSVCPTGVDASLCQAFQVQDATGAWYTANATLGGDGVSIILVAVSPAPPSGATVNATSYGWSLWPITLLYNTAGVPAYPWRESVAAASLSPVRMVHSVQRRR